MSTRGPRGRFLALEPAQAGFKQLEIAVTHVFVAMFSGSLRVSPNVRMNRLMRPKVGLIGPDSMPLGILAQASWRANSGPASSHAAKSDVTAGCARARLGAYGDRSGSRSFSTGCRSVARRCARFGAYGERGGALSSSEGCRSVTAPSCALCDT